MKRFMPVFLFVVSFAAAANAQTRWGVRLGTADGEPMIGGDVIFRLGATNFYFNPSVEASSDLTAINADFHYDIALLRDAAFWVGAGGGEILPKGEDLGFAVRFLAGLGTKRGRYIFYTQVVRSSTTHDTLESYTTIAVGVRF
jgi:hypothetical protein